MPLDINRFIQLSRSIFQETDYDVSCQLSRSLDAFNHLFDLKIKITSRDLTKIENVFEIEYITHHEKWNYVGGTQYPLSLSESFVEGTTQTLKQNLLNYVSQSDASLNISAALKRTKTFLNTVRILDDDFNTRILNTLQNLTVDGIVHVSDYNDEIAQNSFALLNSNIRFHPFRILTTNILDVSATDTNQLARRDIIRNHINSVMEYYYEQKKESIFYVKHGDVSFSGPLFFDASYAIRVSDDSFSNPSIETNDLLEKTYPNEYGDYVFYAIPNGQGLSGEFRTYEETNNLFADTNSNIYTLVNTYTDTSLVDLESFNSHLVPYRFINGDSLNLIAEYDMEHNEYSILRVPPRKYKIQLNLMNYYYDYIPSNSSYHIFYNRDKLNQGILSSSFQANGDPVLVDNGWNYTLSGEQTEIITSIYNSTIPHIKQAFHIQLLDENANNNFNYGVSDLKVGHLLTSYFTETSGNDGFRWKDSLNVTGSRFIQNGNSVDLNTQSEPIMIIQILVNEVIQSGGFLSLHMDTFTNQKKRNASGVLSFDHRMIFDVSMEDFTEISANTNVFLIYPPDKVDSFGHDTNDDINGYSPAYGGLYITTTKVNTTTSDLLGNQSIDWNTNSPISKITLNLSSPNNSSSADFTVRNIKLNINSLLLDYQYYV